MSALHRRINTHTQLATCNLQKHSDINVSADIHKYMCGYQKYIMEAGYLWIKKVIS